MEKEKFEIILKQIEKKLKSTGSENEWDQYAPVISESNSYTAYLTDTFTDPCSYNKLCYKLYNANEYETFTFIINSPGGIIDSAFIIVDAIKRSKAKTIARLVGTVASAATLVALSCDEIEASSDLAFMIHNYSSGMQGKGHEMKARQKFVDDQLAEAFESYYLGFLSKDEINDVIEGKDLWMGEKEVLKRFEDKKSSFVNEGNK